MPKEERSLPKNVLSEKEVRDVLYRLDIVVAKLDAPNEMLFRAINRPYKEIGFGEYLKGIKTFRKDYPGKFALQIMFIEKNKAYAEGRRELREDEYQTACTPACPAGAITFGDLKNPHHKVYKLKKDPNAFRLLEKLGTNPKIYYVSTRAWVRKAGEVYAGEEGKGVTYA